MTADQRDELIRLLQKGREISPEWARILFLPGARLFRHVRLHSMPRAGHRIHR